jgi:adenosylmethionine-8-amino-7-oxononanoate aminotransferase
MSRVLHRSGAIPPIAIRGEGIWLHTADGQAIIDASGGAAVAALGHGNRRIAEAIGRQAAEMAYAHTGAFSNRPAEELADILLHDEPGGLTRAWFCSSGSEGNEAAIKLARQYFLEIGQPQRIRTIARRQSYHGTTLGALAAGGNMMRRKKFEPILSQTHSLVSPCFPYRFQDAGETDMQYLDRLTDELEAEFQRVGPDTVMAFPWSAPPPAASPRCPATSSGSKPSAAGMALC